MQQARNILPHRSAPTRYVLFFSNTLEYTLKILYELVINMEEQYITSGDKKYYYTKESQRLNINIVELAFQTSMRDLNSKDIELTYGEGFGFIFFHHLSPTKETIGTLPIINRGWKASNTSIYFRPIESIESDYDRNEIEDSINKDNLTYAKIWYDKVTGDFKPAPNLSEREMRGWEDKINVVLYLKSSLILELKKKFENEKIISINIECSFNGLLSDSERPSFPHPQLYIHQTKTCTGHLEKIFLSHGYNYITYDLKDYNESNSLDNLKEIMTKNLEFSVSIVRKLEFIIIILILFVVLHFI